MLVQQVDTIFVDYDVILYQMISPAVLDFIIFLKSLKITEITKSNQSAYEINKIREFFQFDEEK